MLCTGLVGLGDNAGYFSKMGHPTYLDSHYILVVQESSLLTVGVDGVVMPPP